MAALSTEISQELVLKENKVLARSRMPQGNHRLGPCIRRDSETRTGQFRPAFVVRGFASKDWIIVAFVKGAYGAA